MAGSAMIVLPISDSSTNRMRRIGSGLRGGFTCCARRCRPVSSAASGRPTQKSMRRMVSICIVSIRRDGVIAGAEPLIEAADLAAVLQRLVRHDRAERGAAGGDSGTIEVARLIG